MDTGALLPWLQVDMGYNRREIASVRQLVCDILLALEEHGGEHATALVRRCVCLVGRGGCAWRPKIMRPSLTSCFPQRMQRMPRVQRVCACVHA